MVGVEHKSYLHEDTCKSCGCSRFQGHTQDCPEYKRAEGITPQHEHAADKDKHLYEKQIAEITATLRETMNAPELVTSDEIGAEKLNGPMIESIKDISARIKASEEAIESLGQYAHSIENQPELEKNLQAINRKVGSVKELYFDVIQASDIDLMKLKKLTEEATTLQYVINQFKREFSGDTVEPTTVLEEKDNGKLTKEVESMVGEIEISLSGIESHIKDTIDTDSVMEESFESLSDGFSTLRDTFDAYKQGSDKVRIQQIYLHVDSVYSAVKILRKQCEPKW